MWLSEFQPYSIDEFVLQKKHLDNLYSLINGNDFQCIIVNGKPGSSVNFMTRTIINETIEQSEHTFKNITFDTITKTEINICCKESHKHIEIIFQPIGSSDKHIIHDFLQNKIQNLSFREDGNMVHKNVILYNVHNLTNKSISILQCLIEKYKHTSRFVLTTHAIHKLSNLLLSRSFIYRVPTVRYEDLYEYVLTILDNKKIKVDENIVNEIIDNNECKISNTINALELFFVHNQTTYCCETIINNVINQIIINTDFSKIRKYIYTLIVNNETGSNIIMMIVRNLLNCKLSIENDSLKHEIVHYGSIYEHRCHVGERCIYHIEAFILKLISIVHHE